MGLEDVGGRELAPSTGGTAAPGLKVRRNSDWICGGYAPADGIHVAGGAGLAVDA